MMPEDKRHLVPKLMDDILCYFDDKYVIRVDPKTALACTRMSLLITRCENSIFNREKFFLTTKILDEEFETIDAILTI
jgi:hypothetical protein